MNPTGDTLVGKLLATAAAFGTADYDFANHAHEIGTDGYLVASPRTMLSAVVDGQAYWSPEFAATLTDWITDEVVAGRPIAYLVLKPLVGPLAGFGAIAMTRFATAEEANAAALAAGNDDYFDLAADGSVPVTAEEEAA